MITPTTRRDVIAHQLVVPWQSQVQVEQDLLLCRAMVALLDASCGRPRILFGHESIASGGDQLRSGDDVKARLRSSGPLIFKSD